MAIEFSPPSSCQTCSAACFVRQNRVSVSLSVLIAAAAAIFASFPALAAADSSGVQYENALPSATGTSSSPSHRGPVAHSSTAQGGTSELGDRSAGTPGSSAPSHSSGRTSDSGRRSPFGDTRPTANTVGQRNSGKRMGRDGGSNNQQMGRAVGGAQLAIGGGSSPLGTIILVAFALAAISIGAVIQRQRRQRQASASPSLPKAG